jgi:hypothetical protein
MKKTQFLAVLILLIGLAVGLIACIGSILGRLRHGYEALDPQTGITLGLASGVTLLSAWLIAAAIRSAGRRAAEAKRQAALAATAHEILEALAGSVASGPSTPGATMDLAAAARALFLHGSVTALRHFRELRGLLAQRDPDGTALALQLNRLLLALRRDCGQSVNGLEGEDWSALIGTAIIGPGYSTPAQSNPTDRFEVPSLVGSALTRLPA